VELDLAKALELYAQSAAQGWAGGQRDLGTMYAKGQVINLGRERERELERKRERARALSNGGAK
jgi:TPR repeat protein